MFPILLTSGPFKVYLFGLFLAVSFLLSTFVIYKLSKDELREEEYLDGYLFSSIIALISARVGYIVLNPDQFGLNILRFVLVREIPGLSLFGGLVGGFLFLTWYAKRKQLPIFHTFDLITIAASFALFLAKIGQFLGGASFGKETSFFLGTKIIGLSGTYHPLELYEACLFFLLGVILVFLNKKASRKKWPDGLVFYLFILGFSAISFLVEFLKVTQVYLYGLSIRQFGALFLLILVLVPLYKRIKTIRLASKK